MEELITGRIYLLKSFRTDDVYIGSTIQSIKARLSNHKADYKRFLSNNYHYKSSYEVVKYGDCYIELIKEVSCTKKQLLILEGYEIVKNTNSINNRIAGHLLMYNNYNEYENMRQKERKKNEKYETHKKELNKEYRENNKEYYYEKQKEWRENNKDWVNEYKKQWRLKQKQKILSE